MRIRLFTLFLFLTVSASGATAPAANARPSGPQIAFDHDTVTVTNVTAKATVVLFSVARQTESYAFRIVQRQATLSDDDGDGKVIYHVQLPVVPRRSVWAAVDMSSGLLALASPPGYSFSTIPLPDHALKQTTPGKVKKIELPNSFVDIVLIRPGVGAWWILAYDGGSMDDDKRVDGKFSLPFTALMPFEATTAAAPDEIRNGDVLVVVDEETLQVLAMGGQK